MSSKAGEVLMKVYFSLYCLGTIPFDINGSQGKSGSCEGLDRLDFAIDWLSCFLWEKIWARVVKGT